MIVVRESTVDRLATAMPAASPDVEMAAALCAPAPGESAGRTSAGAAVVVSVASEVPLVGLAMAWFGVGDIGGCCGANG